MAAAAVPILTTVAGSIIGGLISKKMNKSDSPAAATPVAEAPKVMPLPDDEVAIQAKRRAVARRAASSSSLSTILSDGYAGSDSLG